VVRYRWDHEEERTMDFGDVWLALGIDLQLLQGALMFLYRNDQHFQVIEEAGSYRLELVAPLLEARPACGDKPFRVGIHLIGTLAIGTDPAQPFDAWVRLQPGVAADNPEMMPKGTLSFVEVESVTPSLAHDKLAENFSPSSAGVGKVLAAFRFDVFRDLLVEATRVIHPPLHEDEEVTVDPTEFACDFWPAQPATIRRSSTRRSRTASPNLSWTPRTSWPRASLST